jgi:hypothetical protein
MRRICFTGDECHEEPAISTVTDNGLGRGLRGCDGGARLGSEFKPLLQLLLSGIRPLRLPDQLRRLFLHAVLRHQHQDLQVHGVLSLPGAELLLSVAMLQKRLFVPGSVLQVFVQRLQLRFARNVLLHGKRLLQPGNIAV